MLEKLIGHIQSLDRRTVLILKNIFASFILKGCTGVITLMLVPLTLQCLGEYNNGVWLTISGALLWIENLDIGLGNGLRNKIAEYVACGDWRKARAAVSSTLVMLFAIVCPFMFLLVVFIHFIDLYSILNISHNNIENLVEVVSVSIILFSSTFIMKFIGNVYLGLQLPAISNLLQTGGHPLILLGTYLMCRYHISSLMMIAVLNLSIPLIMYILAYPYTFYIRYPQLRPSLRLFSTEMSKTLFSLGVMFFISQLMSSVVFLSSNIVISRCFSPAMVTPYQITYRYFSILLLVFMVINAPNWTATTDAYQRKDMLWISTTIRRMNKLLLLFGAALFIMICTSKHIYAIWIGGNIEIPLSLTITMAIYIFLMMYSLTYCYFLNGLGLLHLQLLCTIIGILTYAVSAVVLYNVLLDVTAISIAVSLSLLPNAIVNKIQFEKIIKGTASGIWKK